MEVKIGVQYAARELVIESGQSHAEIEQAVAKALGGSPGVLTLVDENGRRVMVPGDKLAYIEIAESESRRVGFGGL